jgi:ABC-type glycerol-3-phosphate transport system substrate-binding protein
MVKKALQMLVVLSLSIAVLAGCSSTKKEETPAPTKPAEQEQTSGTDANSEEAAEAADTNESFTLTVWTHPFVSTDLADSQKKVFDDMAAEFKNTYPNATIVFEEIPWKNREEKMLTALATDQGPDIFYLIPDMMTQFAEKGVLAPVDELLGSDFDYSDFTETSIEAVSYNGHKYGLPILREVQTMFYNTDILAKIGGSADNLPKTMEEFNQLADKAVAAGYYARTFEGGNTLNATLYPYIWAFGGDVIGADNTILINSAESVKAWEEVKRQYDAGYFPADAITSIDQSSMFLEGKSLSAYSSAYMLTLMEGEGMDNYVIGPPVGGVTFGVTGMFVVSAKSANAEKAAQFLSVMTGTEGQKAFNTLTNYIPSRTSALSIHDSNPAMKELAQYVSLAKPGVIHSTARVFMPNVTAQLQAMLEGSMTPQEAADGAADMISMEMN